MPWPPLRSTVPGWGWGQRAETFRIVICALPSLHSLLNSSFGWSSRVTLSRMLSLLPTRATPTPTGSHGTRESRLRCTSVSVTVGFMCTKHAFSKTHRLIHSLVYLTVCIFHLKNDQKPILDYGSMMWMKSLGVKSSHVCNLL